MTQQTLDDEAGANLVGYFGEAINRTFSYFYCVLEFEHDPDFTAEPFDNGRAWGIQTIREACLHTTLIALRDLNDVLTPRSDPSIQHRPDDFRVCDLGFPHPLSFLSPDERRTIHKQVAHSTMPGSELPVQRWKVFDLVTKGVTASLTFLDWIAEEKQTERFQTWTTAIYCSARTRKIYDSLAAIIAERRKAKTSESDVHEAGVPLSPKDSAAPPVTPPSASPS